MKVLAISLLAVAAATLAIAEEPFTSTDAKTAQARYEKEKKTLDDAYTNELKAIQKTYIAGLNGARKTALEKNDLVEAQHLAIAIKEIDGEASPPVSKDGKLQVVSAFYGQNVSWLDVTEKVRGAIKGKTKWSAVVSTKDLGEPAPGFAGPRTLMVRYIVGGKVLFKAVYEGKEILIP